MIARIWITASLLILGGTLGLSTASAECVGGTAGDPYVNLEDCLDTWADGLYQQVADILNSGPHLPP